MTRNIIRTLEDHELAALVSFAADAGRCWKEKLRTNWYFARSFGARGAILHGLRNDPRWGHEGLEAFRLPKS